MQNPVKLSLSVQSTLKALYQNITSKLSKSSIFRSRKPPAASFGGSTKPERLLKDVERRSAVAEPRFSELKNLKMTHALPLRRPFQDLFDRHQVLRCAKESGNLRDQTVLKAHC